jgi:hypothetical protein
MNGKFSRPPADAADAHVPLGTADLKDIICFEHGRTVTNDYRFERRLFRIRNKTLPRPEDKVIVRVGLDGTCSVAREGKPLLFEEIQIPKKGRLASRAA